MPREAAQGRSARPPRRAWGVPLVLLLALGGGARVATQQVVPRAEPALELLPDTTRVTVGQPLTLRVRGRVAPGDRLAAAGLVPIGRAPEGVRILGQDSLSADPRGRVTGTLRVAFFRPGRRVVPALELPYASGEGGTSRRLVSPPLPVEVVRVLPPGDQALRDIKDLVPLHAGGPPLWLLAALVAAAGLLAWLLRRLLRRRAAAPAAEVRARVPTDPFAAALAELDAIERAGWPERGETSRHYAATADVLRRYLEDAERIPALELTTSELAWALPPELGGEGRRDAAREVLGEADLVKFARVRPAPAAAHVFSGGARALLEGWHDASRRARQAAQEAALATASVAGAPPSATAADDEPWRPPDEWSPQPAGPEDDEVR